MFGNPVQRSTSTTLLTLQKTDKNIEYHDQIDIEEKNREKIVSNYMKEKGINDFKFVNNFYQQSTLEEDGIYKNIDAQFDGEENQYTRSQIKAFHYAYTKYDIGTKISWSQVHCPQGIYGGSPYSDNVYTAKSEKEVHDHIEEIKKEEINVKDVIWSYKGINRFDETYFDFMQSNFTPELNYHYIRARITDEHIQTIS